MRVFTPDSNSFVEVDTVGAIIAAYLRHLAQRVEAGDYAPSTLAVVKYELDRYATHFGHLPVTQCRKHDLTDWLSLNPQLKADGTRSRVVGTVVGCFRWAEEEELITSTPYKRPRWLPAGYEPRREATAKEYCTLMRCRSRALRRALYFLRRTGCRTCEMRNLRWDQIDWQESCIVQEEHKTRRHTRKPRMWGIDKRVLRFLDNMRRQHMARTRTLFNDAGVVPETDALNGNVFVNCHGTPWDRHSFARHLRRWAKRCGLDEDASVKHVSGYCFRHMYATQAIEAGIGERMVADQLGHSSTQMLARYSKAGSKKRHLANVAALAAVRKRG